MKKITALTLLVIASFLFIAASPPLSHQETFTQYLTTTDDTTNTIFEFTPPIQDGIVRVEARFLGFNSTSSAGYGRFVHYKIVGGTITQIGTASTIALAEDDFKFESKMSISGGTIIGQVAGNIGKTVNWTAFVNVYYSQ